MSKVNDSKKIIVGELESGSDVIVGTVADLYAVSVPGWIISHPTLSDRSVRLWGYLNGALQKAFTVPGTSHKSLAVLMDVSERTAREAIYELRDAGAISVVPRFANGRQQGNIYYLWPSTPEDTHGSRVAAGRQGGSTLPTVNNNTNTIKEYAQESDTESATPDNRLAKASRGADYSKEFEELWKIYPRRINKGGSYKAYKSSIRKGAKHEDLSLATRNYASDRIGQDDKFTMHGATFFGPQERWKDYLPEVLNALESMTDEQIISAIIYDDYDANGYWFASGATQDDDPEACIDNPSKHGYTRPTNKEGQLVSASGTPYVLDAQGLRRRADYLN